MMRTQQIAGLISLAACVLVCGCRGAGIAPTGESGEKHSRSRQSGQVILSTEAQLEQHITTAAVEAGAGVVPYHAKGVISLPDNATWRVGVLVEGRVEAVKANLGDYVKRGQVLALVRSRAAHEAHAAYANAIAERTRLRAAESLAEKNYERSRRLYTLKAESVSQVETSRQEWTNAQSARREAENNVRMEEAQLRDILGIDPANLDGSLASELTPVKAPADGRILQKNVTPGATISPSADAFVIGDLSRLWMLASVDAEALSQLRDGQRATISIPGVPGATYEGRIGNLGQEFDPVTHFIQVRIVITHPDGRLRPEMLANAEFSARSGTPALLVPQEAIQQVNGQDVVFLQVAPDRFRVQAVKLGEIVEGRSRVLQGINGGDRVITHGSFIAKSELLKTAMGD